MAASAFRTVHARTSSNLCLTPALHGLLIQSPARQAYAAKFHLDSRPGAAGTTRKRRVESLLGLSRRFRFAPRSSDSIPCCRLAEYYQIKAVSGGYESFRHMTKWVPGLVSPHCIGRKYRAEHLHCSANQILMSCSRRIRIPRRR